MATKLAKFEIKKKDLDGDGKISKEELFIYLCKDADIAVPKDHPYIKKTEKKEESEPAKKEAAKPAEPAKKEAAKPAEPEKKEAAKSAEPAKKAAAEPAKKAAKTNSGNNVASDIHIVIERCENCAGHQWNTRHDENKYESYATALKTAIRETDESKTMTFHINDIPKEFMFSDNYQQLM